MPSDAFEIPFIVGHERDPSLPARDREQDVVSKGPTHPLEVHAIRRSETGQDIACSLPRRGGRCKDATAFCERANDVALEVPESRWRQRTSPEFVGHDGTEVLKGSQRAMESLDGLLGSRSPEALDEEVRIKRVFALSAGHRLCDGIDVRPKHRVCPIDEFLAENDHIERGFNGGRGRLGPQDLLGRLQPTGREAEGAGDLAGGS